MSLQMISQKSGKVLNDRIVLSDSLVYLSARGQCSLCSDFFFFSSRRRHTRCGRDWSSDVCSSDLICLALEQQGVEVEVHHHEVAAAGQNEIGTKFNSLVKRADWMQILKYTIWNVSHSYGKTATFMPKPIVGDNGSGMHVHQSVWKGGQNLFTGNGYAGLSDFALF